MANTGFSRRWDNKMACKRLATTKSEFSTSRRKSGLFVVRKSPSLTADALIAHCAGYLTGYKLPRHVEFRDQLPRSGLGKVVRRALREEYLRTHG